MSTSPPVPPRWPVRLGNAAMLAILGAAALALLSLHGEGWWLAPPRPRQWWLAAGCVLAYAGFVAALLWRARHVDPAGPAGPATDAPLPWLVVHASQTGFARELAAHTADALRAAGAQVAMLPLSSLDATTLERTQRALFVASTTGEGDPPDTAAAFVQALLPRPIDLPGLGYAVLALGDRDYAQYCAFGHRLDQWLHACGAQPMFDLVEVDNGDPGALRHWQAHLAQAAGAADMPDWTPPRYDPWRLAARHCLNPGSLGGPAFHLRLAPPPGPQPHWEAGDIAEIGPRNAPAEVEAWLAAGGVDGAADVEFQSRRTTLREALARSRLPTPPGPTRDPQALADALVPLPHREYSIASLPGDGALELVVRLVQDADGRPGLGSGWLCSHAALGDRIDVRIRANPGFRPPPDPRPLLLVGNGTGIAALRAALKARERAGAHRNWLVFGERQQARDALFADELARWQASSVLERADLVFSRDPGGPRYVQDALRAAAPALRDWVAAGADILVCGSLHGMAPGVDAALAEVLGEATLEKLRAQGRYRRDVY